MKRRVPDESCRANPICYAEPPQFDALTRRCNRAVETHCNRSLVHCSPLQAPSQSYFPSTLVSPVTTMEPPEVLLPLVRKSALRQAKRRRLQKYRHCTELVDRQLDSSIASDYENLLFTQMIMVTGPEPCFRCRLCPTNTSFVCNALTELEDTIPKVERHLLFDCSGTPPWLASDIIKAKATHSTQSCPRKPYSNLIWKRMLAHAVYNRTPVRQKRVKFSEILCRERIIPARERKESISVLGRCTNDKMAPSRRQFPSWWFAQAEVTSAGACPLEIWRNVS